MRCVLHLLINLNNTVWVTHKLIFVVSNKYDKSQTYYLKQIISARYALALLLISARYALTLLIQVGKG